MFYVCAICMVSDKANPLMELTRELRQIWERILPPCLKITKLVNCRLLVCLECKQLLDTILKFRRTMTIGARNLLSLHKALEDKHVVKKPTHCYVMPPVLEVVREEVVHSTESWDDIALAAKRPRILDRKEEDAVLFPNGGLRGWKPVHPSAASLLRGPNATERNDATTQDRASLLQGPRATERYDATTQEDDAVLFPNGGLMGWKPVHPPAASLLRGPSATERNDATTQEDDAVLYPNGSLRGWKPVHPPAASLLRGPSATERNDATTQIEAAMPMPKDAKEEIANGDEKIKLNRQLFDAVKATLQSSLTEEFDIKYEPEPEMGCESDLESRREPDFGDDSDLRAGPDSDSTLSCQSDYEDPEHYPNIIFARAFDAISANDSRKKGKELEGEGKAEGVQIHSHIVTNPPSEWPCTWELCQLRAVSEDENLDSPTDGPRNRQATRSRRKGSGRYPCKLCERIFRSQSSRWLHNKRDHVKCDLRNAELGGETELKYHKINHQIKVTNPPHEWPGTWERCQLQALGEDENLESQPDRSRNEQGTSSKRKGDARRFKCKFCEKSFRHASTRWKHCNSLHMVVVPVKCDMCSKEFSDETELKFHRINHQIKMSAGLEYAPHACEQCGARYHYPRSLQQHLNSSTHAAVTLWSFQCDTCKRKFPDKKRIVRHIQREHLEKERVKCPMCRSTFKNAYSLRQHARAHILAQTQDNADKQTNAQHNTSTTTDKISEIKKYSNRQDNTHTYVNEQESKQHLNGQTHNINNTHTDIHGTYNTHTDTQGTDNTHTDIQTNGQINTDANKINTARRRVQKRRKKCPYARKRASKRAPMVQEPAVAKASLFDMLSSFIL